MTDAIKGIEPLGKTSGTNAINKTNSTPAHSPAGTGSSELTFSRHLSERINRRNLDLSNDKMTRLSDAVTKAAGKGSKDSLVLLDDLAVLVNVTKRTVLTAIDKGNMKDGVFTNIDSVVVG